MSELSQSQLLEGLRRAFIGEGEDHRVVFWHDERREFETRVEELPLADLAPGGVTLMRLGQVSDLEVKLTVERRHPGGRFLLYASFAQPAPEDDWLLDIRLYSRHFHADQASMLLAELGLERQSLKAHLQARLELFAHAQGQRRLTELRSRVAPLDDADAVDLKMMAVLTGAKAADFDHILIALSDDAVAKKHSDHLLTSGEGDPAGPGSPSAIKGADPVSEVLRFGLEEAFWRFAGVRYGFTDPSPTLAKLLSRMMVTEFARWLDHADVPSTLQPLVLPKGPGASNAQHCLSLWRDSVGHHASFDTWSRRVARTHEVDKRIAGFSRQSLERVPTFLDCERVVLARMLEELQEAANAPASTFDLAAFQAAIAARKSSHWVRRDYQDAHKVNRSRFMSAYLAMEAAAEFVDLYREHAAGFAYDSAEKLWAAYEAKLHRFDGAYRRTTEHALKVAEAHTDLLKPLQKTIEDLYCNWYLEHLQDAWMPFVTQAAGQGAPALLERWRLEGAPPQGSFYKRFVAGPLAVSTGPKKAFVIISDALRYEVAQELAAALGKTHRLKASLSSMLGVVPSYTALGMASLLPHGKLTYEPSGVVKADGKTTAGLENRSKILSSVHGAAFDADELRGLTKVEARKAVNGHDVVYLYERGIDAVGDKAATEDQTFLAARQTIDKLQDLVAFAINTLNASYVLVTADHGFLYTNSKPTEVDKSALEEKPNGAYVTKKRYVVGKDLPQAGAFLKGKVSTTSDVAGDEEFLVPRGTQLFHFTGGARFVHGGVMPQEVMVPVITVRKLRGKTAEEQRPVPVEVHLLGGPHRIVTNRHRLVLMQMEAVHGRRLPAHLRIGVFEGDAPLSNVEEVLFDSQSEVMEDRKREVWLTVKGDDLAKKQCMIKITNVDTDKVQVFPVTIDIAFNAVDF